jgi:glycosyltransferase involved in cell wall biosynthesis
MKIAIFTEYYPDHSDPASGVYVHLRAAGYRRAGHDVHVYRVSSGAPAATDYEGVPVSTGELAELPTLVSSFEPDVVAVHTPYPGTGHTRLAETVTVPKVLWIHGYEALLTALHGYHRGFARLLSIPHDLRKLWRLRQSLQRAAAVVYVSQWMRHTAERYLSFSHPRSHIIPNPVDTDRFTPGPDRDARTGRPRGMALRKFRPQYGLDIAIAAYATLDETDLTIIGTGPDAERLRQQIRALRAPVHLEERFVSHHELPGLFNSFDYLVAPARTESQGLTTCEAMACQLPVIASNVGGVPEFVRQDQDGFLTDPGDVRQLREAVLKIVHDPERARAMGASARERIRDLCSPATLIPRELELLAEVAR